MKLLFLILPFLGSVLALVARDLQAACTCEPVVCLDSWPDSCYCANDAKKACYEKCGGTPPTYDTCPPRSIAVRAPQEAAPTPVSTPTPTPTSPSTCVCEPVVCLDSWPDSCYCNNTAKKNCYEKCGGELPKYQTCPPREVVPEPDPTECQCPEVVCIQSFPEGCYCANNAKLQCYEKCGGEKPVLSSCD
ncbi:hypothetical protein COCC4DRAFT_56390 [Bipolaris maydis ATCC 48331]|uniref:Extracellular membrane protein CFEM domain-containing protein n=2 Tax=Cochliobolus heterostrophus TaxID=5016 RepID=M2UNX2_COCH5|nr:uncharacterized protein COCC4DRAFT_56390 [Bipolaris maydis ATCC 48331]EMD89637.1 hypothetical protein COCHEDRAFT_1156679 [Bipolaris maydis C5]KAJ5064259.1 hypothetical protein J3E74DRAFT_24910 [Bipolaris maydis]ENI10151.1 hypothetical protein COCC4DRAFT_56390 [Bipolaris maydis ATCC 48331]KAJ6196593.1 hypothetical protein J3E72DRAFT_46074 [Bipolaris maydis]KAJ6269862.1 hypothetical protein PSV08DRAFT_48636 [Bipolaris maydis]